MQSSNIVTICEKYVSKFDTVIKNIPYEIRGIFNSEMLLAVSLIEEFWIEEIVESWRARGHSTSILCEYFKWTSKKIVSIDFDKNSPDTNYSEERLKQYDNIELIYGDAFKVLPHRSFKNTALLIDWPKWDAAIALALQLVRKWGIKLVMIHDIHQNTFDRDVFNIVFSDTFYSDNREFVDRFSSLDGNCWKVLEGTGEAPYIRKGMDIVSYASTLGIANMQENGLNTLIAQNFEEKFKSQQPSLKKV